MPGLQVMRVDNEVVEITQISPVVGERYAVDSRQVVLFYTKWTLGHQLVVSIWVLLGVAVFQGLCSSQCQQTKINACEV